MQRAFRVFIAAAAIAAFAVSTAASGSEETNFLKKIEAGVSYDSVSLGKKPTSLKYSIDRSGFFVGREDGTRFYWTDNNTSIDKNSDTHKFGTTLHTKDYGMIVNFRFAKVPRQNFAVGYGRKEVHTDPYMDYTWMPLAGAWNSGLVQQAEVYSNPTYFNYSYDLPEGTRLGLGYTSANVKLDTIAGLSVRTKAYTLSARHKWGRNTGSLSYTKFKSNRAPSNSNIELGYRRSLWKGLNADLKLGMYSHGAPTTGGCFSDIGEQYIFSYLAGDTAFDRIFTEKTGYMSLGLNYVFSSR